MWKRHFNARKRTQRSHRQLGIGQPLCALRVLSRLIPLHGVLHTERGDFLVRLFRIVFPSRPMIRFAGGLRDIPMKAAKRAETKIKDDNDSYENQES